MTAKTPESDTGLRLLIPGDEERLCRLRHRAIRECAWNFGTPSEIELARSPRYYRRMLEKQAAAGTAATIGWWNGNELCGMVGVRRSGQPLSRCGMLYSMYVVPEQRGRGAGKKLVSAGLDFLVKACGIRRCQLNVEVQNKQALRLYLAAGFVMRGTEKEAFTINGRSYDVHLLEWSSPASGSRHHTPSTS